MAPITVPKARPIPRTDVDPTFNAVLKELQTQCETAAKARLSGQPVPWLMPPKNEWSGDLNDIEGIAKPFDAKKIGEQFLESTSDAASPGTVGDLVVATTQVDYMAAMERSFRFRHSSSRVRAVCHAAARQKMHGDEHGPLIAGALEYVRGLVKSNKKASQ